MRKRENSTEITALKWTAAGLSITIALLVGLLAFLIRQQAGAYSPPTERSTEEISVTEGVGTETDTGAVTVPVAHAAGQSATDAPTAADPPPTSEPDTETDPETATGQTGIWQTEIRVSVGLTFADNPDGTCTVTGLGDCTDACLILPPVSPDGRVVSAIGARAFAGSDIPVTVYIPVTVTDIGAEAFSGCARLAFFTAEVGQTACRAVDGVLYSSDMTRLLCYPPARDAGTLILPGTLERIEDGAFRGTSALREIRFAGTAADFSCLYIGSGNNILSAVGVTFCAETKN